MQEFIAGIFPAQNLPEGSNEGLPYWIFWLLLCVIVLLLAFIFLRDKDLRHRLDTFFAGIKKRLIKIRLHSILKKENIKQEGFINELGRKTWEIDIKIPFGETIWEKINKLEKTKIDLEIEKTEIEAKITSLKKNLNEFLKNYKNQNQGLESEKNPINLQLKEINQKEKEIEGQVILEQTKLEENTKQQNMLKKEIIDLADNNDLDEKTKNKTQQDVKKKIDPIEQKIVKINQFINGLVAKKTKLERDSQDQKNRIDDLNQNIRDLAEDKKYQSRKYQREIKEWEKNKEKIHDKIKDIKKQNRPLFTNLGRLVNEKRVEHKELALFYSKIDRTVKRKKEIEGQIQKLD